MYDISLPITKEQFDEGVINFIHKFKRLPYMDGDDIEVEFKNDDGEIELRPYRSNKYIKAFYDNQNTMTEQYFKNGALSYEFIAGMFGLTGTIVKNIMGCKTKKPAVEARRYLDMFFNKDFYEGSLSIYCDECTNCKKKCKQHYYAIVRCKNKK